MKKKMIAVVLAACLLSLTACKPDGMNQRTYDLAMKALEAEKAYIDADISKESVKSQINDVFDRLDGLDLHTVEAIRNATVMLELSSFEFALNHDDFEEMEESLDDLKEMLGE